MTPPRTYLFALVDGGGTVPPELGTVRRLVDRGHRVTVLAEESMRDEVAATGATYRPWAEAPNRASRRAEDDPYRDWECKNPVAALRPAARQAVRRPGARVRGRRARRRRRRPTRPDRDLVLRPRGHGRARRRRVCPTTCCSPTPTCSPRRGCRPSGSASSPPPAPSAGCATASSPGSAPAPGTRGSRGSTPCGPSTASPPQTSVFEGILNARRVLVLTSADFDFPAELPANVRYVGAVLDDPTWATTPWTPPPGDDPLVLVALSSTFQDQGDCLQRIVDAAGSLPVRALVTTGPALDPTTINAPANVSVVAAAPHSEVLREAAAVVTHGGHGTVVRALAADVPLVVLHHGRDQADNAARLKARGAGLAVKRTASPADDRQGAAAGARRPVLPRRRRPPGRVDPTGCRQWRPGRRARGPPSGRRPQSPRPRLPRVSRWLRDGCSGCGGRGSSGPTRASGG